MSIEINHHPSNSLIIFTLFLHFRLIKDLPHNRNTFRMTRNGHQEIVSFLSELPRTEHDPQSFGVDLTLFTVNNEKRFGN